MSNLQNISYINTNQNNSTNNTLNNSTNFNKNNTLNNNTNFSKNNTLNNNTNFSKNNTQKNNRISKKRPVKRNYNTPEYRHIGINVLYYRRQLGLSQQQLADRADVSRTHLSNIESNNGSTSISMDLLFRLARALEISPSRLLLMPEDFER